MAEENTPPVKEDPMAHAPSGWTSRQIGNHPDQLKEDGHRRTTNDAQPLTHYKRGQTGRRGGPRGV